MSTRIQIPSIEELREKHIPKWQLISDLVDQCIDLMLNLRQSGHPGGSRSKVLPLITTLLSGAMRFDIREPGKRFGDRFVLVAGHTVPLIYAALAVCNEALRIRYKETGDSKYLINNQEKHALFWEDLLTLRHRGGLSGHAEMEGKSLFLKFNTGPSGHGSPAAVGEATALRLAGMDDVRVFAFEGEGGLTTGVTHESKNSAFGLGLGNLVYFIDWNDYGIDARAYSTVVNGTPVDWFEPYGFHCEGTEQGENFDELAQSYIRLLNTSNPTEYEKEKITPKMLWAKTRKGRGYGKFDEKSHGSAHAMNSDLFWQTKKDFAEKYNTAFPAMGQAAPKDPKEQEEQTRQNFQIVFDVLKNNRDVLEYLADRLVEIGDSVPQDAPTFRLSGKYPLSDPSLLDYKNYPTKFYAAPGTSIANRAALDKFGSWINTVSREKFGRPLIIGASADLAESTNMAGVMKGWEGAANFGFFNKVNNTTGTLLPQPITEMANAGIMAGLATVNFSDKPYEEYNGFIGACSTYGSFSYLKYGPFRLFSQLVQDSALKCGKIIWIAGHSGVETAEDFRTHFGIFAPGVTQLFPKGKIINLHPYEHNEVFPALAAALASDIPLIALHLTRPAVKIPDREKLGMASHFEAAKGAYLIRAYDPSKPKAGTIIIRGTSSTSNIIDLLPRINSEGPNVKIVAAISEDLFRLQSKEYRDSVISEADFNDAMVITNGALKLMNDWIYNKIVEEYSLSADFDDQWRTGGSVDECIDEAHLDKTSIWNAITRFSNERSNRLERLKNGIPSQ